MIRVLVVSDVRFHREGLLRMLCAEPDFEVTAAPDEHETLTTIRTGEVDVALLDLVVLDGRPLVRAIHSIAPAVRVVALGLSDTGNAVVPWAEAGAAGYVSRDCSLAELGTIVRSIADGDSPCAPTVSAALFRRVAHLAGGTAQSAAAKLTTREIEIAALLCRGMSNHEIARVLTISLSTVKNHVHNLLSKLNVTRRTDVATLQPIDGPQVAR